jgi:hypothetical protein
VGIEQFVLPAAVVEIAIVDVTILVDVIVERQLGLAERLTVHDDVIRLQAHSCFSRADYNKVFPAPQTRNRCGCAFSFTFS